MAAGIQRLLRRTHKPFGPRRPVCLIGVHGAQIGLVGGRDPERVSLAYTPDSRWRNRSEFLQGRAAIVSFLQRKWAHENDYRLVKELWAFTDDRIAVRFAYEWHDLTGAWFRSYGNENWVFDAQGLMRERHAGINDIAIGATNRKFYWDRTGPRPVDYPGPEQIGALTVASAR